MCVLCKYVCPFVSLFGESLEFLLVFQRKLLPPSPPYTSGLSTDRWPKSEHFPFDTTGRLWLESDRTCCAPSSVLLGLENWTIHFSLESLHWSASTQVVFVLPKEASSIPQLRMEFSSKWLCDFVWNITYMFLINKMDITYSKYFHLLSVWFSFKHWGGRCQQIRQNPAPVELTFWVVELVVGSGGRHMIATRRWHLKDVLKKLKGVLWERTYVYNFLIFSLASNRDLEQVLHFETEIRYVIGKRLFQFWAVQNVLIWHSTASGFQIIKRTQYFKL